MSERTRRSTTSWAYLIAAVGAILACGGEEGPGTPAGPSAPRSVAVSMVSSGGGGYSPPTYGFSPGSLTISQGDTVVWRNGTAAIHRVTSNAGGFDSGDLASGATYRRVFDQTGTYPYHCVYHSTQGMTGTITVAP